MSAPTRISARDCEILRNATPVTIGSFTEAGDHCASPGPRNSTFPATRLTRPTRPEGAGAEAAAVAAAACGLSSGMRSCDDGGDKRRRGDAARKEELHRIPCVDSVPSKSSKLAPFVSNNRLVNSLFAGSVLQQMTTVADLDRIYAGVTDTSGLRSSRGR